jgi:protein O-GlcNAc transferase
MQYLKNAAVTLKNATAWHGAGRLPEAESAYQEVLRAQPDNQDALHLLGVLYTQSGRREQGIAAMEKSLAINSRQPFVHANLGNALLALGRYSSSIERFRRSLTLAPDNALAHYGLSCALLAARDPANALESAERAVAAAPDFAEAHNARGSALAGLSRREEALASFDRALLIKPTLATALVNRGTALLETNSAQAALRDFRQAIALSPVLPKAHCGAGSALLTLNRKDEALRHFDKALTYALQLTDSSGQTAAGVVADPHIGDTLFTCGVALVVLGNHLKALTSFRRLERVDPNRDYIKGARLHAQLQLCDWSGYQASVDGLIESMGQGHRVDYPLSFISVCDSPSLQLLCGRQYAEQIGAPKARLSNGDVYLHERIRVGYVSADFLEHPVSYLIAELLERHDRSRFELVAISLRDDPLSATGRRVKASFDRVFEVADQTDLAIAQLMRDQEIDIAVDLMGYTASHRANIFNHRPAPVQVSFLGLPATTGASEIDYIIADRVLVPEDLQAHYSESIVYMPDCFQVTDSRKVVATESPTRAQLRLPESAFVFCSFHSSHKVSPLMFDAWCRLLCGIPDSVLWLVSRGPDIERHLVREAEARGVEPKRLVFARPLPYSEHLARLPLADLCLDTLPFNGGTTTSDALWMGLPVLTCAGRSFAARMSASLLQALDLGELITGNMAEYEERALQIARDPARFAQLRTKLRRNAKEGHLFDADRYRRHLEMAYTIMTQRNADRSGLRHIHVPPID